MGFGWGWGGAGGGGEGALIGPPALCLCRPLTRRWASRREAAVFVWNLQRFDEVGGGVGWAGSVTSLCCSPHQTAKELMICS